MAAEPALTLDGVTKRFGGLAVCDGIGFSVPAGARMALIGPNGAGKTTLFNLISGVYGIDSGSIRLHGQPIHKLPPRKRVQVRLGPPTDLALYRRPSGGAALIAATDAVMADISGLLGELRGENPPAERWNPAAHGQNETGRLEP